MSALVRRSVVLVTGMSGTGKSTALAELARRGHHVVDTDDQAGWITEVQTPDRPKPIWELERIRALVDGHRAGWLFVSGCVANQGAVYDLFDAVVLLSAPIEVISVLRRSRQSPFGSRAEDRAKIASDLVTFEPLLRAEAHYEIVTTAPVAEVVAEPERAAVVNRQR